MTRPGRHPGGWARGSGAEGGRARREGAAGSAARRSRPRRSTALRPGPLLALVALLWSSALGRDSWEAWITRTDLPPLTPTQSAEVTDRHGQLLQAYQVGSGIWRMGAAPAAVDPNYIAMLLAYEDKRFYRHNGVDLRAMARASLSALRHGEIRSGGSTLTMQTARLLEASGTGSWRGKLRQMRLAWALERRLSKDQILTLYLALAPFGGNVEGIRAATLTWLGKEPARLTPAEAALLVALPQSPNARRPDRDTKAARAARDRVLARAHKAGAITASAMAAARLDPLPNTRRDFPALAPHMAGHLRRAAPEALHIRSTLDAGLQTRLTALARAHMRGQDKALSIAILLANHQTGEILASVGSPGLDRAQGHVDMTRALRSPGSTLKPLIYALAMDQGMIHPDTLIDDRPTAFGPYVPQNFDGHFRGELRVSEALKLSLNIPPVLLTEALGPHELMAALRRAGARPQVPGGKPGLAIALGGMGISLHDLVQLYAGLANGGAARPLHSTPAPAAQAGRITSASAAWQVSHILTQTPAPPGTPKGQIAWKTGTSYGHRDAWAIGYDGAHVAGVWIGRPDGTPVPGAFGAHLAAPVLFQSFQRLGPHTDLPPPPPETLMPGSPLPEPLKRFRPRHAPLAANAPELAFPPDGAELAKGPDRLTVKLRRGTPPFTPMLNGAPLPPERRREFTLPHPGQGFTTLTVIDATGQSATARLKLD